MATGCGSACVEADRMACILLRLRLSGMASIESVALAEELDLTVVAQMLAEAVDQDLVVERLGDRAGWVLTAEGRRVGEKLLQHQLDCAVSGTAATGRSPRVEVLKAYERFVPLNGSVLDLCTRWQVVGRDPLVLNDHSDPDYDQAIIHDLAGIHERVKPVCRMLSQAHPRFARYERRLESALSNVIEGRVDWLTKPTVDSYHTIWFELHDDFLATLGLDRAREHARLRAEVGSPQGREN